MGGGSSQDAPDGSSGARGPTGSRLPQLAVPCREGTARHRFVSVKWPRHRDEVPDANGCFCSKVNSLGGLDVLHQPEGHIL